MNLEKYLPLTIDPMVVYTFYIEKEHRTHELKGYYKATNYSFEEYKKKVKEVSL